MTRALLLITTTAAVFLSPLRANQRASGFCQQGAIAVVTSGATSTTKVQGSYPLCTVSVFLAGTTTPAIIYQDNSNTPLANPFTANSSGLWFFYTSNGRYDVQLSGGTPALPAPWTIGDVLLNDPGAMGTVVNTFNGRSGTVTPLAGDYTAAQVTNAASLVANNTYSGNQTFNGQTFFTTSATFNGGTASFAVPMNVTGNQTWTGDVIDARLATHTLPFRSGTISAKPGTCTQAEVYFATDATAGVNLFYCTSTNVWTQQSSGGGGGGGSTTFDLIGSGTNTSATMTVGSGATLNASGTGIVSFASAGHTAPMRVGTAAGITAASCAQGETAFATDATAGQNIYFCTSTNTWTQQLNSGGGGGSAFSALSGGTNTSAAMIVGSGASLTVSGSGTINATQINGGSVPTAGNIWKTNVSSQPAAAAAADVVNLFSSCSGTQYLGADGGCHTASGGGTSPFTDATAILFNSSDNTKLLRFSLSGFTTGTTRVVTVPNASFTLAGQDIANTFSAANSFSASQLFSNSANPASAPSISATITSNAQPAISIQNSGTNLGINDLSTGGSTFAGTVTAGAFTTAGAVTATNQLTLASLTTINSGGTLSLYKGEVTGGRGLADVVFHTSATGQQSNQTVNVLVNGGTAPAGDYLINIALGCTSLGSAASQFVTTTLQYPGGPSGGNGNTPVTLFQGASTPPGVGGSNTSQIDCSSSDPASIVGALPIPTQSIHTTGGANIVVGFVSTMTVGGTGGQFFYYITVLRLN